MLKHKFTASDYFLILVNLIPLYGVWFEGWNAAQMFLVYSVETMIIGAVNVLKMAIVTLFVRPKDEWVSGGNTSMQSGWFFIFFFMVHYGIFVFVQTQIFFGVSNIIRSNSLFGKYAAIPEALGNEGRMILYIFIAYYTLQAFFNFFQSGEYKEISLSKLMFQPYGRIIVQQLVVIAGSIFLQFGAGNVFIVILAATKLFFDIYIDFDRLMAMAEKKGNYKKDKDH